MSSSGTIQIEQFDPKSEHERLRACHAIAMSAWEIDNPGVPPLTFETYVAQWQAFDGSPVHAFLATDPAGRPVGYCRITLPAKENLSMALCALTVTLDQRRAGTGTALLSQCAAVARAAGRTRLAASAFDGTPGMPQWAAQEDTVVLPPHRGHRLGLLVKIEMMDVLARQAPEVRHVITGNAGQNEHMIAINEQLGYTISSITRTWDLEVS